MTLPVATLVPSPASSSTIGTWKLTGTNQTINWYSRRLPGLSEGDVIEIEFDLPTNQAPIFDTIDFHDAFGMSAPIAEGVDAVWRSSTVLQVRALGRVGTQLARDLISVSKQGTPSEASIVVFTPDGQMGLRPNSSIDSAGSDLLPANEWLHVLRDTLPAPPDWRSETESYTVWNNDSLPELPKPSTVLTSTLTPGIGLRRENDSTPVNLRLGSNSGVPAIATRMASSGSEERTILSAVVSCCDESADACPPLDWRRRSLGASIVSDSEDISTMAGRCPANPWMTSRSRSAPPSSATLRAALRWRVML